MSHWRTHPAADPRTWLPRAARGVRAPGHTGTPETCPRCVPPPQPVARVTKPEVHPSPTTPRTVRQLILLAAGKVAAERLGWVPIGPLVVAAWQLAPDRFGLEIDGDHRRYPSSNRVQAKLVGEDGLVGLGWLEIAGTNLWRVTRKGARKLRELGASPT